MRIGPPSQRSQPQFHVLEVCLAGGGAWISFQMQYIQPLVDARISDKFLWESPVLDFCGGKWPSPPLKYKFCYSLKKVLGVQRPGRFISLLSITVQKPRGEISLLEDRKGFSFFLTLFQMTRDVLTAMLWTRARQSSKSAGRGQWKLGWGSVFPCVWASLNLFLQGR